MTREIRLTNEAETKLERLLAVYKELELTPDQALALTLAKDLAADLTELKSEDHDPDTFDLIVEAEGMLWEWQDGAYDSWRDVLLEVPQYLTDK